MITLSMLGNMVKFGKLWLNFAEIVTISLHASPEYVVVQLSRDAGGRALELRGEEAKALVQLLEDVDRQAQAAAARAAMLGGKDGGGMIPPMVPTLN